MKENDCILRMQGITKYFAGVVALDGVDFQLRKGEIHALIGENGAGKSTLMKILLGMHRKDEGTIIYRGREVNYRSPADALNDGITMIHQEISLVPQMTIAENIWLGRESTYFGSHFSIDRKRRLKETQELLDRLHIDLDAKTTVQSLSVAQMQLVELARAVSYNAEIIIMDEPTSALTDEEIHLLYSVVKDLAAQEKSIIFISHKLEEIYAICDTITVLRDGKFIASDRCENISQDQLMTMIAGREIDDIYPKIETKKGEEVIRVEGLSSTGVFEDISFQVKAGEILGVSGLMGAGRTEIMRAIFGLDHCDSGKIFLNGQEVQIRSPRQAVSLGIGMVTEDRMRTGAIYQMSIFQNTTIARLSELSSGPGIISRKKEQDDFKNSVTRTSVKYASQNEPIGDLSGGNQQKVLIARWLSENVKVLIFDEPTRGIDVGAKTEIYYLIKELAGEGIAVIVVSSELPELLGISDRIMVISGGRKTYECENKDVKQEELMKYAFQTDASGNA